MTFPPSRKYVNTRTRDSEGFDDETPTGPATGTILLKYRSELLRARCKTF